MFAVPAYEACLQPRVKDLCFFSGNRRFTAHLLQMGDAYVGQHSHRRLEDRNHPVHLPYMVNSHLKDTIPALSSQSEDTQGEAEFAVEIARSPCSRSQDAGDAGDRFLGSAFSAAAGDTHRLQARDEMQVRARQRVQAGKYIVAAQYCNGNFPKRSRYLFKRHNHSTRFAGLNLCKERDGVNFIPFEGEKERTGSALPAVDLHVADAHSPTSHAPCIAKRGYLVRIKCKLGNILMFTHGLSWTA
ncbi:hypothetical protein SDC9_135866 [bioreactor metagenome]|uniref:Uncharacterized protein n=1 Tax=bioreactor metagenome TaxID=1076179 RepID=A0A645DJL0_9ZZZZ